jgi:hypothetical protein
MSPVDLGTRGLIALVFLSALSTLGAVMVFRRFSDGAAIRRAGNLILAHLMELGLFFDEPALVLRAQRDLIRENVNLLRLIALPCALLALPFAIFYVGLDAIFGRAPLVIGAPAVLTVQESKTSPGVEATSVLQAPPGIEVETPGMRIVSAHEISWRIRPVQDVRGRLTIALGGRAVTQPVFAGSGWIYAFPFPASPVRIPYPHATILRIDWVVWYLLISAVTALTWNACQRRHC